MTCIAWDGKALAGDRQSTFAGTPTVTRKVHRIHRDDGGLALTGAAGDTGECQAYIRWATGKVKGRPSFTNILVISIDEQRRIWCATDNMHWYEVGSKFWAIGSGADLALGAMAAGANARKAVLIASKLHNTCGMGVDVVRF